MEMFKKSILIVAHPDDEALWFTSILDKVDEVVLCFLEVDSNAMWTTGRRKCIDEHPMGNISCLGLRESGVFDAANWQRPERTRFGLEISSKNFSDKIYKKNYNQLKRLLQNKLSSYSNVFTHNPWGEYGNEEHVQVYRVVRELQKKHHFTLWFSNYCSNKSLNLMLQHISEFSSSYVILRTNKRLGHRLRNLYRRHDCWTWYDDFVWSNEEVFMPDNEPQEGDGAYGHVFPLNLVKIQLAKQADHPPESRRLSLRKALRKLLHYREAVRKRRTQVGHAK